MRKYGTGLLCSILPLREKIAGLRDTIWDAILTALKSWRVTLIQKLNIEKKKKLKSKNCYGQKYPHLIPPGARHMDGAILLATRWWR